MLLIDFIFSLLLPTNDDVTLMDTYVEKWT